MKIKKFLATLLSVAMVLSMLSVGALANENEENGVMPIAETEDTAPVTTSFGDAADSWATTSIERWSATGIVKGDNNGNFNPEAQLSRAELAQIFVNMLGLTEKAENTFADLTGSEWYADAILKCAAAGIMKGDGVNAKAETNISRGETIVMFGRAVGVTPDAEPDLSDFTDADAVADWAAGYLAPLTKMGILSGSGDGTINAIGDIDRASTMSLLDKAIGEYVNAPGEYEVKDANKFVVINVAAKEGEVVISGTAAGVTVSAGTAEGKIVAKDLKADSIKVDGTAALSVEGKSAVGAVVANATGEVAIAKGVTVNTVTANAAGTINNSGTVKELVANAPAKVDNQGTITKAEVKADGVVLDGKKPTDVKVDEGTKNPTNSSGTEIKPTPDRPTGGGGGGSSVTYADVIKATLHDTRADAGEAGTYVADEDIAKNYSVSGTVSGDEVNVTVTANHLMQHKAGDGAGLGYWVGVGIPQSTTDTENQYAVGFGDYDKTNETFDATRDNTMEQNSKTYDTFYFGVRENTTKGYIAVKNGEKTTVYNITFNVTLAPVVENVKVFAVYDETTYNQLPASYVADYKWDASYAIDNPGGSACGLPWLVVTYDRNVPTVTYTITKNNAAVSFSAGTTSPATIGAGKYQMWRMVEHLGQSEDAFGTYAVTMTAAGESVTASTEYLDTTAVYHTVTFDGAQSIKVKAGAVINAPVAPTKTGHTFDGWYTDKADEGTKLTSGTTTAVVGDNLTAGTIAYVSKWTPNTYTIAFDANTGAGDTIANIADVKYDVDQKLTKNTYTKVGYTFNGWNTLADGTGTAYADEATVKNLAATGTVTLYAQWTADTYAITYNLNGGTNHEDNTATYAYGTGLTLAAPTKTSSEFLGWYSEATFETKVTEITGTATGAKTFYALWADPANGTLLGEEPEQIPDYTFASAYTAAGVTYASNVVTVDGEKLAEVVSAPKGNAYITMENAENPGKLWAGLTYAAPENATTYEIVWAKVDGSNADTQKTTLMEKTQNRAVRDSKTAVDFIPVWNGTATPAVEDAGQIAYVKWENAEGKTLGVSMIKTEVAFTNTLEAVTLGADTLLLDSTSLATLATDTAFDGIADHASYLNILKTSSGKYWLFGEYTALTGEIPGFGTVGTTEGLAGCIILPFRFTAADLEATEVVARLADEDNALKVTIGSDTRTYKKSALEEEGTSWTRLLQFDMEKATNGLTFEIQWAPDAEGPIGTYEVSFGALTANQE